MPELTITIGGREFVVACQDGEEQFLTSAAALLDNEATVLNTQIGRLPEARMLLMSGLMLADKAAGMEEDMRALEDRLAAAEEALKTRDAEIAALKAAPPPAPEKIEVAVIPDSVRESMSEVAARAESLADALEEKAKAGA